MNPSPALVAGSTQPATSSLLVARGRDGRRVRPGDRVGYLVRDGLWARGHLLHLQEDLDGTTVAWVLASAPGIAAVDVVPVERCLKLRWRRRVS